MTMRSNELFVLHLVLAFTWFSSVFAAGPVEEENEFVEFLDRDLQEETRVNIFQKLGESLGLAIFGILLLCLAPVLIWKVCKVPLFLTRYDGVLT